MARYPNFKRIEIEKIPDYLHTFFEQNEHVLLDLGFKAIESIYVQDNAATDGDTKIQNFVKFFVNRSTKDMAMLTHIRTGHIQNTYLEFSSEFSNSALIDTNNTEEIGVLRQDPLTQRHQFPKIRDPRVLFRIHTYLTEQIQTKTVLKIIPKEGNEISYISQSMPKTLEKQVKFGYLYFDQISGLYRPTLKGAFIMTWKLLWPCSRFRIMLRDMKGDKILKIVGARHEAAASV